MHAMTLHAQADLWQHRTATFAALFMEGEMWSSDTEADRTDVLFSAVMNRGLRLATDLPRLALRPRRGWAIHLNPAGALTLTWPHVQPLLLDAPLNLPPAGARQQQNTAWCCSSSATASACATTPGARSTPANARPSKP